MMSSQSTWVATLEIGESPPQVTVECAAMKSPQGMLVAILEIGKSHSSSNGRVCRNAESPKHVGIDIGVECAAMKSPQSTWVATSEIGESLSSSNG